MINPDKSHKSILLVEDEVITAILKKMELENLGYYITHVTNGEAAVEKSLDGYSRIDLILMDINLGDGIDGIQAAEAILTRAEIPVIFLTSQKESEVAERMKSITSYGYVDKSSSLSILDFSIKRAFNLFSEQREQKIREPL